MEDRGSQFTLLLAVDYATGCVSSTLFCLEETTHDYFLLIDDLVGRWGVPLSLYTDRHAVFTPRIDTGPKSPGETQFTRAMEELGIELIFARSPQAMGSVERMAGTFQDRLVTELRLAGASTVAEANEVLQDLLPRFNNQVRVPARELETAYRSLDPDINVDRIFCFKHPRKIARDNTLKYRWHTLQLAPHERQPSYAGLRVEVLEGLDGSLRVQHTCRIVPSQPAPQRPRTLRRLDESVASKSIPYHLNGDGLHTEHGHAIDAKTNRVRTRVYDVRRRVATPPHMPNRRQRAWWKAIHQARVRDASIRGIARDLGMSRITVRKYLAAEEPEIVGTIRTEVNGQSRRTVKRTLSLDGDTIEGQRQVGVDTGAIRGVEGAMPGRAPPVVIKSPCFIRSLPYTRA